MCGRYQSSSSTPVLAERYLAEPDGAVDETVPSWNVAPTAVVRVVRNTDGRRRLETARWGLLLGGDGARALINTRAETIAARPAFRQVLRSGRVVVPADGFYEWRPPEAAPGATPRRPGGGKPFHFRRADGDLIAMAGLWAARRAGDGGWLATMSIVTVAAGPDLAGIHHRMPVVLEEGDWQGWIDPGADPGDLDRLLRPSPAGTLTARPVSDAVNRPANDGPHLLDPPGERDDRGGDPPGQQSLFG